MTPQRETERRRDACQLADAGHLLEIAAITDRGPVRRENQDDWRVVPLEGSGAALLVADGMGGHANGGEAARTAVNAAAQSLQAASDAHAGIRAAFLAADEAVRRGRQGTEISGTTLVGAVVAGGRVTIANVGDSRAYVLGPGRIERITRDHSLYEDMVELREHHPEQVVSLPGRNILTRVVTGDGAHPDLFSTELHPNDVLLLCSDGFWGVLEDADIAVLLDSPHQPLSLLVERALDSALAAATRDNVTLLACRAMAPQR